MLPELLKKLIGLGCEPDFLMLSEKENEPFSVSEWTVQKELIARYFPHTEIVTGFTNKI